jgi:hypothetical protein
MRSLQGRLLIVGGGEKVFVILVYHIDGHYVQFLTPSGHIFGISISI